MMPWIHDRWGKPVLIGPQRKQFLSEEMIAFGDLYDYAAPTEQAGPQEATKSGRRAKLKKGNRIAEILLKVPKARHVLAYHLACEFPDITVDEILTIFRRWPNSPQNFRSHARILAAESRS